MTKNLFDRLRESLAQDIKKSLDALWPELSLNIDGIYNLLVLPPQKDMGHLAWGTFPLAKGLRMAPPQIALKLAEQLQKDIQEHSSSLISKVQAVGPYVNFFFSSHGLSEQILKPILNHSYFEIELFSKAPKTMVEFSQPNTHKELHVGHMRNACLGDSVVRLLKYAGVPVVSTTFPGDVGTHVAKCLWYLKSKNQEPVPETHRGEWLGRMYTKAHLYIEDHGQDAEAAEIKDQLTMILKQIEAKEGAYFNLWKETRQWSIQTMESVYAWCGIKFDHWYWESDVDSDSVATIKRYFAAGQLIESQGAIGIDLSDENLGFCVLLKSDGNGLYSTKDVELARRKFSEHRIEQSIYVVDTRQALHFKQVFATLKRLGFKEADSCYHLQYNFVELPDGAMSSRKGNIIPLTELTHRMEKHVKNQYLQRYVGEWTSEEIESTARIVAQGAIKYGMVRMDPNKKIVFDMEEWLKLDGESGPYIQYAYARIQSVLRKFQTDLDMKTQLNHSMDGVLGSTLQHEVELQLLILLGQLNSVVALAVESHRPNVVCNYLYEVAKLFSQFYHECSIGHAETELLKTERLYLAQATGAVLKEGLALIGIPVPDRM